jgi:hypothetical protein
MDWFMRNWMGAGLVAGLFLLALVPLLIGAWSLPLLLIYMQLVVYLLHQFEEHYEDRFRLFANLHVAHGLNALTTPAVVFINVPGVWGVILVSLYLARFVDVGLGLIAVYLVLVNTVAHVAASVVLRMYNPGLVTALVLFLPVGTWALLVISAVPGVTMTHQVIGFGVALAIHAGIMIYLKQRMRILSAAGAVAAH